MNGNNAEEVDVDYPVAVAGHGALALQSQQTPEVILARARKAAVALKDVVDHKIKPVKMNGETYLEFEDWQTLGNFYNMAAKVDSTNFVQYGEAQGFEAKASVIDKNTGATITAAESMCLNDEEKWCSRTKYEYHYALKDGTSSLEDPGSGNIVWEENPSVPGKKRPKKVKVNAGVVAVPLFQLRSMAQTRACAKALRNALAWVVVLAGYKATPAEELDGMTDKETGKAPHADKPADPATHKTPQRKSETALTPEQIKAAEDAAKAKYTADNPGKPPAAAQPPPSKSAAPAGSKTATGCVIFAGKPNAGGYRGFAVEGQQDKDGKDIMFATKDTAIIDEMLGYIQTGEHVNVQYTETVNGRYTNHNIIGVSKA